MAEKTLSAILADMRSMPRGMRAQGGHRPPAPAAAAAPARPDGKLTAEVARAAAAVRANPDILRRNQRSYLRPLMQRSGSGPMGLDEMQSRAQGMEVLDAFFGTEEQLRAPDAMDAQIAAREKANQYESLLPYGSFSSIKAHYGSGMGPLSGAEIGSEAVGERLLGEPTRAEAAALEREQFKSLPQRIQAEQDQGRSSLARELAKLREDLEADVAAGRRTEEEAARVFDEAATKAAVIADLLKRGTSGQRDEF